MIFQIHSIVNNNITMKLYDNFITQGASHHCYRLPEDLLESQ